MQIANYFNPFSSEFSNAARDFHHLPTRCQKVAAVIAAIAGGVFSFFILFTGSFAAFRFVVEKYTKALNLKDMIRGYNDYELHKIRTVSYLHDTTVVFKEKRKGRPDVHEQGKNLEKSYYFQCNRGGGNCFYLGFSSAWLHYLLREKVEKGEDSSFNDAITLLQEYPNDYTKAVVDALQGLNEEASFKNLYDLLRDEKQMEAFIMCFREIAIHGLNTIYDDTPGKEGCLQWDNGSLSAIIFDSEDLQRAVSNSQSEEQTRSLYCNYQKTDGVDVQSPEIAMLNQLICPISICGSLDNQDPMLQGFPYDYPEGRPITLFRWTNHYDTLIPK